MTVPVRLVGLRTGRFQVTFDLPNPRPNGNMVVAVSILGPDGQPTGERPALGEDGLMGGIVFGES